MTKCRDPVFQPLRTPTALTCHLITTKMKGRSLLSPLPISSAHSCCTWGVPSLEARYKLRLIKLKLPLQESRKVTNQKVNVTRRNSYCIGRIWSRRINKILSAQPAVREHRPTVFELSIRIVLPRATAVATGRARWTHEYHGILVTRTRRHSLVCSIIPWK